MFWKVLIVIAALISAGLIIRGFSPTKKDEYPYSKKKFFLTITEKDFFGILKDAVGDDYYIIPQVNLSKLLTIREGRDYYNYYNKINRKSVDFVIMDKIYLNPLLAIELDDSSHNLETRKERDKFVDEVLENAGLPILRFKARKFYNIQETKSLIYNSIKQETKRSDESVLKISS